MCKEHVKINFQLMCKYFEEINKNLIKKNRAQTIVHLTYLPTFRP